jgi:hypothetical protein
MQMARRRVVFGSGLRAGARAVSALLRAWAPAQPVSASFLVLAWARGVSASLRVLVPAQPVSASLLVLAWARGVSALSPALASEETAPKAR